MLKMPPKPCSPRLINLLPPPRQLPSRLLLRDLKELLLQAHRSSILYRTTASTRLVYSPRRALLTVAPTLQAPVEKPPAWLGLPRQWASLATHISSLVRVTLYSLDVLIQNGISGPMTILPLRRLFIERQIQPEMLSFVPTEEVVALFEMWVSSQQRHRGTLS
jgi:hypothetical protein